MKTKQKLSRGTLRSTLGQFISHGDLLSLMLAVYLGSALGKFFNSLVTGIVLPLIGVVINKIRGTFEKSKKPSDIKTWTMDIFGAKIHYGQILSEFIQLMIGVYIAYLFVHYFIEEYLDR